MLTPSYAMLLAVVVVIFVTMCGATVHKGDGGRCTVATETGRLIDLSAIQPYASDIPVQYWGNVSLVFMAFDACRPVQPCSMCQPCARKGNAMLWTPGWLQCEHSFAVVSRSWDQREQAVEVRMANDLGDMFTMRISCGTGSLIQHLNENVVKSGRPGSLHYRAWFTDQRICAPPTPPPTPKPTLPATCAVTTETGRVIDLTPIGVPAAPLRMPTQRDGVVVLGPYFGIGLCQPNPSINYRCAKDSFVSVWQPGGERGNGTCQHSFPLALERTWNTDMQSVDLLYGNANGDTFQIVVSCSSGPDACFDFLPTLNSKFLITEGGTREKPTVHYGAWFVDPRICVVPPTCAPPPPH